MDVKNRKFLTNEQQLVLREWEALEKLPAWEWVVADAQSKKEQLQQQLMYAVQNEKELYLARGQILVLDNLIAMIDLMAAQFTAMTDDADLARAEILDSTGANS